MRCLGGYLDDFRLKEIGTDIAFTKRKEMDDMVDLKRDFIDTFVPSKDTRAYLHSIHHEFSDLEKATIVANHRMLASDDKIEWLATFADSISDEALKSRIFYAIAELERTGGGCDGLMGDRDGLFDFIFIPHDFRHGDIVTSLCDDFSTLQFSETIGIILCYFDEDYEYYRNSRTWGDYSDVQICVDIKFDGTEYQGEFHHQHINPIYIERLTLHKKDERRVYLDYLINVYAKRHMSDKRQEKSDTGTYSMQLEYVSEPKSVLEQKYLGNYLPVYDEESGLWCVQTGHGFEYGSIDYVVAEFSGSGLIYHFKENGKIDHEHSFEAVLERLIGSGGNLEIMEEYGEYSDKERQFIKSVENALDFVGQHQRPMTETELRKNGEYSACEAEKRYLLLVTADWNHDADEWIGIYSDNDELRNAYEKSLSEFETMRKEGHYCDAQYLAIVEFTERGSKEQEHNRSYSDFSCEQRFREVKPEELRCFKNSSE